MQNKLYQEPAVYEALFNPGLRDLPFYLEAARAAGGSVLELGCGTGRLLWPLRREGMAMEGLDASAEMLEACTAAGKALGLGAPLHQADWRHFDLGRQFSAIFLPFNGLQHLHSDQDLSAFFARVRVQLLPGGRFVLDLHLPQPLILARDPTEHFGVDEGPSTPGGERVVAEKSSYEPWTQVLTQTWTLAANDGSMRELTLALRQFFPQELQKLLKSEGFRVLAVQGDFDDMAKEKGSVRQVLHCERI